MDYRIYYNTILLKCKARVSKKQNAAASRHFLAEMLRVCQSGILPEREDQVGNLLLHMFGIRSDLLEAAVIVGSG